MSTGYKIHEKDGAYFLTFQIVGWVDIFTRLDYCETVIESFKYSQKHKGLNLFAFVIMSNHIHLLAQSEVGDLSGFIRDFKSYTSKRFVEIMRSDKESRKEWMEMVFRYHAKFKSGQTFQFWTHKNHAEHIYSQKFIEQKVHYIHYNPVRSGIVVNPEDYLYSSARNYAGLESIIDVIKVDFNWKTYF
ncbi:MAG TPA: transposase [Tenuifilaceae bacterium]|jgi:REP element-mobilizing transposase RayT|nr:transposase [Bacteroidales bacterium]MDI9515429.1 transposase [Bacteroidota bacterium]NLH57622.1 transposase [Rikenellaceae bacterium]OQC62370.1 MAG: Transposase IS200 like protein [Bacteroidetes bacterium ADurb.Bin008]HNV82411.1 transposase [Tenuifilaceae bacterium]